MKNENIKLYSTEWARTSSELCEQINKQLKFGWQPLGGICFNGALDIYLQVMVRFD
jgi:hypothetical protein